MALHRVGVDLTHVPALIALADVSYPQLPRFLFGVGDSDPLVFGDDVVLDGQDCLGINPQPRNLEQKKLFSLKPVFFPLRKQHQK